MIADKQEGTGGYVETKAAVMQSYLCFTEWRERVIRLSKEDV